MPREAGYTLLEVLVAFVVLVLVLGAIYQRLGVSVRAMGAAEAAARAAEDADRLLTELGRSRPLAYGLSEGDLPDGLHWRLLVSPTLPRPTGAVLPRVEGHDVALTLSWTERGRTGVADFKTLRLGLER